MNMRHDPDWADHAREDWIYEKEQERLRNELQKKQSVQNGCGNNCKSKGLPCKESKLLTSGIKDSL